MCMSPGDLVELHILIQEVQDGDSESLFLTGGPGDASTAGPLPTLHSKNVKCGLRNRELRADSGASHKGKNGILYPLPSPFKVGIFKSYHGLESAENFLKLVLETRAQKYLLSKLGVEPRNLHF